MRLLVISPAKNEADFLPGLIDSMKAQTRPPDHWVIVDDQSTDQTGAIARREAETVPWMHVVSAPDRTQRDFSAKVRSFNAGLHSVDWGSFDLIGNIDSDLTLEPGVLELLVDQFQKDETLGVAGVPFVDNGQSYDFQFSNINHVSGAVQIFRRECYQAIGGYQPVRIGGIDWIAVARARLEGWRTRTFTESKVFHHRPMGTALSSKQRYFYRLGTQDYFFGGSARWQLLRGLYQMSKKPRILGGSFLLAGFFRHWIQWRPRIVDRELALFHKGEQLQRLKNFVRRGRS